MTPREGSAGTALKFIVLLGLVSLFADMTYEGGRSLVGPFLGSLGASATAVGCVAGLGEFAGYALRMVSGYLIDRIGRSWTLAIWGYTVNLFALPLLAFVGRWQVGGLLVVAERLGKGVRAPARDAMLSYATKRVGRGWGFGIHEALDQVGAVSGPVIVAGVLLSGESYRTAFAVLVIPAVVALALLMVARRIYPQPRDLEIAEIPPQTPKTALFARRFWVYLLAVAFLSAGYADFPLIAYHFQKGGVVVPAYIPLFYALAMGADAVSALIFGRLFDRLGVRALAIAIFVSAFFAPLAFFGDSVTALAGVALWGFGMGAQESVMRAGIANIVPPNFRGRAYGIFYTACGIAWFAGSAFMGALYDTSPIFLVAFSVALQMVAIPVLLQVKETGAHPS
ncbi:MAG: MFS transporter [bacterium JZ-2024 1]